ncbi:hypothetical protein ABIA32_002722 [Streptacidiphilus sp. MAP12-20]|uniref:hypothetical protein n=1 Tax=Streptacidiphilus sp. MAP12-20 TaxID=3156299 RepID=UPI0035146B34
MPFYLRAHLGPIGWSTRLGSSRRPSQQGNGCAWITLATVAIGVLVAIIRWWYISLPIILVLGSLLALWIASIRREAVKPPEEDFELLVKLKADTSAPQSTPPPLQNTAVSQPSALIVVQGPQPLNWRDHVTLREVRDDVPYYELKASSVEMAEQIQALMEADGWSVTIERFTGH